MPTAKTECCPEAPNGQVYAYVNSVGDFYNVYTGTIMNMATWTGGPVTDVYGKCVLHQASPQGYGAFEEPLDCPCCAPPYVFIWGSGCTNPSNLKDRAEPVPCIICICPDPPPPPECEGCVNPSIPIVFQLNTNIKTCVDCEKQGEPRLTYNRKTNTFIAGPLIDPIVIFKLR